MRVSVYACLLLWSWPASAANPDRWSPSMLPSTGVRLDVGHSENRLTAHVNRLFFQGPLGPLRLGLALSAPTSQNNQPSASLDPGFFPFGYAGKLSIAWDTTYHTRYAVEIPRLLRVHLCRQRRAKMPKRCDPQTLERWLNRHKSLVKKWQQTQLALKGWHEHWRQKQQRLQRRWHLLRRLSTTLLTMPFTTRLARRCRPLIQPALRTHVRHLLGPKASVHHVERRACIIAVEKMRITQQKLALAHRLKGLKLYRKYKVDASLYKAIVAFRNAMDARQRDLSRRLPPVVPHWFGRTLFFSAGFEIFGAFRQLSAYPALDALRTSDYLSPTLQFGPTFGLYLSPRWAFQLRLGLDYRLPIEVKQAQRCAALPKTKGQPQRRCEYIDVLAEPPTPNVHMYVRGGVTALFDLDCCSTTFGVEVRAGIENLSFAKGTDDAVLELQFVFFGLSRITSILGRFHAGFHLGIPLGEGALQRAAGAGFLVLPFVGFGAGI